MTRTNLKKLAGSACPVGHRPRPLARIIPVCMLAAVTIANAKETMMTEKPGTNSHSKSPIPAKNKKVNLQNPAKGTGKVASTSGRQGNPDSPRDDRTVKEMKKFEQLKQLRWKEIFNDPCTGDWHDRWTLDGLKATVTNSEKGMDFRAGPVRKEDASHAVMWTKKSFAGDIRVDYEYTRLDKAIEAVTILYLQATGSGADGYDVDISKWADNRRIPAMRTYFNHMNLLHISYAAYGQLSEYVPGYDYIRARRYMPKKSGGLANTDFDPSYFRTGLFKTDVPHRITVIKTGDALFMHVRNDEQEKLCHWETGAFPRILEGRIGLRHMWTRAARYRDFRVSTPADE